MTSDRLASLYRSPAWAALRRHVIARADGRCEFVATNVFGEKVRCTVRDKSWGGRDALTVNHKDIHEDPRDPAFLEALCRPHHGHVDGGRAGRKKSWR